MHRLPKPLWSEILDELIYQAGTSYLLKMKVIEFLSVNQAVKEKAVEFGYACMVALAEENKIELTFLFGDGPKRYFHCICDRCKRNMYAYGECWFLPKWKVRKFLEIWKDTTPETIHTDSRMIEFNKRMKLLHK